MSEVPILAGMDELSAVGTGAADGTGGDALCPLLPKVPMFGAVATLGRAAALDVTCGLVLGAAAVASAAGVRG